MLPKWDTSDCFRALKSKKNSNIAAQVKTLFHDVFSQNSCSRLNSVLESLFTETPWNDMNIYNLTYTFSLACLF